VSHIPPTDFSCIQLLRSVLVLACLAGAAAWWTDQLTSSTHCDTGFKLTQIQDTTVTGSFAPIRLQRWKCTCEACLPDVNNVNKIYSSCQANPPCTRDVKSVTEVTSTLEKVMSYYEFRAKPTDGTITDANRQSTINKIYELQDTHQADRLKDIKLLSTSSERRVSKQASESFSQ
jgi:hypothetical protein